MNRKSLTDQTLEEQLRGRIYKLMQKRGIETVVELARLSHIEEAQFNRMMRGERHLSLQYLRPICGPLQCQVADLFSEEDAAPTEPRIDDRLRTSMDGLAHELASVGDQLAGLQPKLKRQEKQLEEILRPWLAKTAAGPGATQPQAHEGDVQATEDHVEGKP